MSVFVFDTGPLIDLFRHYYRSRFPSLWRRFDAVVADGRATSTREVSNELVRRKSKRGDDEASRWCKDHPGFFPAPSAEELTVVRQIFETPHHRMLIEKKKRMGGGPAADPFVIARAKLLPDGCVVTTELERPHAAKIPNVCDALGADCINLERFMEKEGWQF